MFNIDELRIQIEQLIRDNPELAEDDELRADMLEGCTDLYSALNALLDAAGETLMMANALTERIDALVARRARFKRRVEYLRGLMLKVMQSADLKKIELPDATLSQRYSPQQIVGEIDPDQLPDDLVRIVREADRVKIREALLDHREVPGLTLSNAPPTLTIRVK